MARDSVAPDRREYVRVSVDLPLHPKLATIDDPHASWLYVASLCYCGGNLTDGTFQLVVVARMAGVDKEIGKKLISVGMWHEQGHDCPKCPQPPDGALVVHDYLRHQRSRSDADRARAAGRTAAAARWDAKRMRSASDSQSGSHAEPNADRNADGMRSAYEPHPDGESMRSVCEPQCDSDATPNAEEEVEEERYVRTSPSVGGPGGEASQQAAPPTPKAKRGTRITADWWPSDTKRASLRERFDRPDQWWRDEVRAFVNHFLQKTGRDATSLDWDARFDNWARESIRKEGGPRPATYRGNGRRDQVANVTSAIDLARRLDAEERAAEQTQPHLLAIEGAM